MVARQHAPELAFLDTDRVRLLAAPIEDAGDHPVLAQPPGLPRPAVLALLNFQTDPFAGHTGGEV